MGKTATTENGQIAGTPPLAEESLAEIPAKRGIVLLRSPDGRAIQLLSSANLRATVQGRFRPAEAETPTRRANLREITADVSWTLTNSWFESDLRYFQKARQLWPKDFANRLGFQEPWFVHADLAEDYPHLRSVREMGSRPGRYLGPFESGRSAGRFIEILQENFRLCRDARCLRQAGRGRRCVYAELGRCLNVCGGEVASETYRAAVAEALGCGGGDRAALRAMLTREMADAAANLQFERAGQSKARLEGLAALEAPEFRFVRPGEQFAFVLIQRGPTRRKAQSFLSVRGQLKAGALLDYPLAETQVGRVLARMEKQVDRDEPIDEVGRWHIALVAHYLRCSRDRRGLILPWRPGLGPAELAAAIERSHEALALRKPKPRAARTSAKPKAKPSKAAGGGVSRPGGTLS